MHTNYKNLQKSQLIQLKSFFDMKYIFTFLFLAVSIIATAQTIAVQGVLRDPKGRTVDDGYYKVIFSIYQDQSEGTALWTETHPSLRTNNGLFVAKLGTYGALDVAFDTTYYLGIAIEGRAEISPRMELSLAPYAMAVYGKDNQFPSTGDVGIKTRLIVEEGNIRVAEGDMHLENGSVQLDTGNLNIQQGNIFLNKDGAGIQFADGTALTTAFGGTAANLSNNNTVIIAADTDLDNTGSIDLNIGDTTFMRIQNNGTISFAKDLVLDSGQIMVKNGKELPIGHINTDSSFSEVMNMKADGTVIFSGTVKANGTAMEDNDLVNVATLNQYLSPSSSGQYDDNSLLSLASLLENSTIQRVFEIGQITEGGTVFATDANYAYIANYRPTGLVVAQSETWTSSYDFGAGYDNTQALLAATTGYQSSFTYVQYHLTREVDGYSDWYLPSKDELSMVLTNTSIVPLNTWISTSSRCAAGMVEYLRLDVVGTTPRDDCDAASSGNSYRNVFIRRVALSKASIEPTNIVTVGYLLSQVETLEAQIDRLAGPPIGTTAGGRTVFANSGGYVFIAATNSTSRHPYDFGSSSGITYAGYSDWFVPSPAMVTRVQDNTDLAPLNGLPFWTNESCAPGDYTAIDASGSTSCRGYSITATVLLIRKMFASDL